MKDGPEGEPSPRTTIRLTFARLPLDAVRRLRGRRLAIRRANTLLIIGGTLLGAILVDYLATWPFLMTPLYAIPVLLAARRLSPRGVGATAALATITNLASGLIQGTPLEVVLLYTSGLIMTAYLAVFLAWQRQETDRHAREAAQHAEAAEAARQNLQRFLSMVTHELRHPLTAILGYTQIFQRNFAQTTPTRQRQSLASIEAAANHMRRLIDDLHDAGLIGAGGFQLRIEHGELVEIVQRVVDLEQAAAASHHLILDAPERLEVEWDSERIGQLLTNLISNAIKYSPAGSTVRVIVQTTADEVLVRVSDQGMGIKAAEIGRLFQPFARLVSGQEAQGSGLGLYISKAIAEAHGGWIRVESEPGQGSTFTVILPHKARGSAR